MELDYKITICGFYYIVGVDEMKQRVKQRQQNPKNTKTMDEDDAEP